MMVRAVVEARGQRLALAEGSEGRRTDVGAGLLVELGGGDLIVLLADTGVGVLLDDDVTLAELGEHLGGSLEQEAVCSVGQLKDDSHGLALRAERDHLDDLGVVTSLAVVGPSLADSEREEGGLGLGADESSLGAVLVGSLEGGRVDGDRVIEKLAEAGRDVLVDVGHVGREVEATLAGRSGLELLLLRVDLLGVAVVVGVGTGGVLGEAVGELEVDTDGAGDDRHLVLGEGSGLVGADDGSVGHGLASAENTDEEGGLGHATSSESEGESDGEGKSYEAERDVSAALVPASRRSLTFGDSDNNNGDRDNENLDEVLSLLIGSAVGVASEVDEEAARRAGQPACSDLMASKSSPNHERGEEDETGGGSELGDELGESVKLELEGSVLGVALERCRRVVKVSE